MSNVRNSYDYIFPILGKCEDGDRIPPGGVFGTAFHLGNGLFATAGHVLENAVACGGPTFGMPDSETQKIYMHQPDYYRVDKTRDFGMMMFTKLNNFPHFNMGVLFDNSKATMSRDVAAIGYPFAYDTASETLNVRYFKGHIVSVATCDKLPAKPEVYELSFQAPKGLSGAPLLLDFNVGHANTVAGIIFETAIRVMSVPDNEEISNDGNIKITYRYEHYLSLAQALLLNEIRDVYFDEIGRTVIEHLKS